MSCGLVPEMALLLGCHLSLNGNKVFAPQRGDSSSDPGDCATRGQQLPVTGPSEQEMRMTSAPMSSVPERDTNLFF